MRLVNGMKAMAWAVAWTATALPAAAAATGAISPSWAESRHPFTLALSGESDKCAPVFSHQSSRITGGKLELSVLEQERPGVLCVSTPVSRPYRAEFDIPAMDSGEYPVQVRWAQACEFDPTPCPVAYQPQDVGNLRVTDSAALAYSFAPRSARGGQAFHIRLKAAVFNCGDLVKSATVDTARPLLHLNFTIEPHPEVVCIAPFPGIDFAVPPLEAGGWQVLAGRGIYCPTGTVCPIAAVAPQLAGALEVSPEIEAVGPLRPGSASAPALPAGMGRPGFRSEWNGVFRDAAGKAMRP